MDSLGCTRPPCHVAVYWSLRLIGLSVGLAALLFRTDASLACPFCGVAEVTLQKRIAANEVAIIAKWVGGEPGNLEADVPASTRFDVQHVFHGDGFEPAQSIVIDRFHPGQPGELFLLGANTQEDLLIWERATSLTERAVEYLRTAPDAALPSPERLQFFIQWLEDDETILANDAFNEFANARYEDIAAVSEHLPHEKLAHWVFDREAEPVRLGVYGMLLGLCGVPADADRLEAMILEPTAPADIRLGIDGVMGGYLLLAGERGLEVLDRSVLGHLQAADGEVTAAISALRFIWEFGDGCIPADRLRLSMRLVLGRPERISLACADLARWQDWETVDRLMEIYDDERLATRHEKTAIIKFLCAAEKVDPAGLSTSQTQAVERARQHLRRLRSASRNWWTGLSARQRFARMPQVSLPVPFSRGALRCCHSPRSRPPCRSPASTAGCCTTFAAATCWPGAC